MKLNRQLFSDTDLLRKVISKLTSEIESTAVAVPGYLKRCFLHFIMENYQAALGDINIVLEMEPDNPSFHCFRGLIYGKMDEDENAWDDFEKANEIMPFYVPGIMGKAVNEFFQADNILAEVEINNVLDIDPRNPRGYLYRGIIRQNNEDYFDSIKDLKRAEELCPFWESITKKMIGRAFLKDGIHSINEERFEKAVICLLQFIESEPENPEGYFHIGGAYLHLEEWEDALKSFHQALKLGKGKKIGKDAAEMIEIVESLIADSEEDNDYEEEIEDSDEEDSDDEEEDEEEDEDAENDMTEK